MKSILALFAALQFSAASAATTEIPTVLAHPLFGQPFACVEHWQGNLKELGDSLGTDCMIQELVEDHGRTWMRSYKRDGSRNEDWYVWDKEVLSPCSCEVLKTGVNPTTNRPGVLGKAPASYVELKRDDGVIFLVVHVAKIAVKPGDKIESGQVIAHVGNNGFSRHPHIHMGAYKGDEPMQIHFDQAAMGRLFEK